MDINKNNPFANAKGIAEKKSILKGLSKGAKMVAKQTNQRTNEVLVDSFKDKNHQEFHTFMDWKKKGFAVQKGAKAFCVWSSPIKKEVKNAKGETEEKDTEYFGIAHLFSNYQVKKGEK